MFTSQEIETVTSAIEDQDLRHRVRELMAKHTQEQPDKVGEYDYLYSKLLTASGLPYVLEYKHWVKEVTGIDEEAKGGFMFRGVFVPEGGIRVPSGKILYLVAATTGSIRIRTTRYKLVWKHADGTLEALPPVVDGDTPGWAGRLLPHVRQALGW
jgi:hypothetical protein